MLCVICIDSWSFYGYTLFVRFLLAVFIMAKKIYASCNRTETLSDSPFVWTRMSDGFGDSSDTSSESLKGSSWSPSSIVPSWLSNWPWAEISRSSSALLWSSRRNVEFEIPREFVTGLGLGMTMITGCSGDCNPPVFIRIWLETKFGPMGFGTGAKFIGGKFCFQKTIILLSQFM